MDDEFPIYTPVIHKKDGYSGWIYDSEFKNQEWKYRIVLKGNSIKSVNAEDIERILTNGEFPFFLFPNHNFSSIPGVELVKESMLHVLGYKVSKNGYTADGRWKILEYVAIPILGLDKVAGMIWWCINKGPLIDDAIEKWLTDLEMILGKFGEDPALKKLKLPEQVKVARDQFKAGIFRKRRTAPVDGA